MKCRLCDEEHSLRKSHVYSEQLWRPLYGSQHTARSLKPGLPYIRDIRKGVRERLLCQRCEDLLREHEDYFAKVWFVKKRLPTIVGTSSLSLGVFRYREFKLFHLSQLWRAAVSSEYVVKLGPHAERLRLMLLNGDPGPPSVYSLTAAVIVKSETREVVYGLLAPHAPSRVDGTRTYQAIYGGCCWSIAVASQPVERVDQLCEEPFTVDVVTLEELTGLYDLLDEHS